MRLSSAYAFLIPKSLRLRIFAVCFVGTHIPLLSFVVARAASGHLLWSDVIILLIATLIGTIGALWCIHFILAPLRLSIDGVASIGRGEPVNLASRGGTDEMSELLRRVNEAAASVHSRLSNLDHAAHRDPLTGVFNRRGFFAQVDPLFANHVGGAFAILDLDRFKSVNDRFGHATGDQLLRDFAERLTLACGSTTVVARWGGEEFVVYFPRTDEQEARGILETLLASLSTAPVGPAGLPPVTFSAGLVESGSESVERTAERADAALYAAKRAGRAQVVMERDLVTRASE